MVRNTATPRPVLWGLTVVFIGWLAWLIFPQDRDWWLSLVKGAGQGLGDAWAWVWSPLPVPRALVAVAALLLVLYAVRRLVSRSAGPAPSVATEEEPAEIRGLAEDERKILQMLAAGDGEPVWFNQIREELSSSKLRAEHSIAMLRGRNLIRWFSDSIHTGSAHLTPLGRAACVYYGWSK
jgi:hypothetical protein